MAYLYEHKRLDNDETFYIGISLKDDCKHARAHTSKGRNKLWKNIVEKVGYKVFIIMDNITPEVAKEKEVEFIALYGRRNLGLGPLANLTDGGDGTSRHVVSDKSRETQRARRGWHHTDEAKARMSIAQKGIRNKPEAIEKYKLTIKKMLADGYRANNKIVIDVETGIFYISALDAHASLNLSISESYFRMMLRGKCKNKTSCTYI